MLAINCITVNNKHMETHNQEKLVDLDIVIDNFSELQDVVFGVDSLMPKVFPNYSERVAALACGVATELRPDLDIQSIEEYVLISDFLDGIKSPDKRSQDGIIERIEFDDLFDQFSGGYGEIIAKIDEYETQSVIESRYVRSMRDNIIILAHIESVLHHYDEQKKEEKRIPIIESGYLDKGIKLYFENSAEVLGIDRYTDDLPEIVQFRANLVERLINVVLAAKTANNSKN
jgi:hypothetical protein